MGTSNPAPGTACTACPGSAGWEVAHQLHDLAREAFLIPEERAPNGTCSDLIRSRSPSKSEVNPPGVQRREGTELLGDQKRGMIWQHDAASADPNAGSSGGNVRERDRGCRTRDAWQIVVLGHPKAPISEGLDMARKVKRVVQRLTDVAALGNGREVKNGKRDHEANTCTMFVRQRL
jgi:hypothetical protein